MNAPRRPARPRPEGGAAGPDYFLSDRYVDDLRAMRERLKNDPELARVFGRRDR
jgi:hypothetical protein